LGFHANYQSSFAVDYNVHRMLVKEVLRCVESLLMEDGFHSGVHGILLRPIRPGFAMFLGLNTATHRGDGMVGINPVVGLRDDAVQNLLTELTGHRWIGPTLSIPLGYLMPERRYIEWEFGTADSAVAMALRDSIRTFGYPAVQSLANHEAVIEMLKEMKEKRQKFTTLYRPYQLPVAYLLRGRKDLAIQELHCELDNIRERMDTAAMEYRLFAEKLENRATAVEQNIR
jgi:hypothetical protein